MHQFTAIYKNRACSKKAATTDKVKALNEKMAVACDKALEKDRAKEERKERRAAFKAARLEKKKETV